MSWLLDTCVISELVKPRPKTSVVAWIEGNGEDTMFLSVITIGELEKGISRLPGSTKRKQLERWVRHDLAERFRDRLLAIDLNIAARWGTIIGVAEADGQPLPVIDAIIAATALQHDMAIVTRNTGDLERCGAPCVNPWLET